MVSITVKDIPKELYLRLKERAKRNRRSLNREAIACLESVINISRVDPKESLLLVREIRQGVEGYLKDSEVNQLKNQGRP